MRKPGAKRRTIPRSRVSSLDSRLTRRVKRQSGVRPKRRLTSRRNPGDKHVAGLEPKYERAYEQIKKSYIKAGTPEATAKTWAAQTAWDLQAGRNPVGRRPPGGKKVVRKHIPRRTGRKAMAKNATSSKKKARSTKPRKSESSKVHAFIESFIPGPVAALAPNKGRRPNPSDRTASRISRGFHGRDPQWGKATVSRHVKGQAAAGLGDLASIRVRRNGAARNADRIYFPKGTKLVATGTRNLAISGRHWKPAAIRNCGVKNPNDLADVGKVVEVEYVTDKPHLGYPKRTLFFHEHGEETGRCPRLLIDSDGYGLIQGGKMRVTPEGIVD